MKKIYILITLTIAMLMATPMLEEEALALFEDIRQSEYAWAVLQWEKEMKIKVNSRSSKRKSIWQENHENIPSNTTSNEALRTVSTPTPTTSVSTTTVTTTLPAITNISSSVPSIP